VLFDLLAGSFWATTGILCGLFYLDYALTIRGQELYREPWR